MKKYITSNYLYSPNLPVPWYTFDNPFSEEFVKRDEYLIEQIFNKDYKIPYIFDEFGFRKSDGFDSEYWFFGCSLVFGESLEIENIFPKLVADQAGSYYNFGTCGASLSLVARLLYKLRNKLENKKLIISLPYPGRFETIRDNMFMNLVPNHNYYEELAPTQNLLNFLDYTTLQAVMMIDALTAKNKRIFLSVDEHKFYQKINPLITRNCIVDLAADGNHYGVESNKNIANLILSNL